MHKSRPQVKNKLNEWCNWPVSHIPKPIKEKASRAFKAAKDNIMGLYKRVKGKESKGPVAPAFQTVEPETRIKLIESQIRIRIYQVTGSLNQD